MDARLSPEQRAASLAGMSSAELDVLVVGGGAVGAGAALDAVTRGLSVGLVEMGDWASGSSSRSSMLVNGGLRHLDSLELGQMYAAQRERALLFDRLAPHLVRRVPLLFPLHHPGWERVHLGAGLWLYDTMGHSLAPGRGLPSHRHLSRRSVRRIAPGLRHDVVGAVQYYGAQVDDARYVVTLVRTALGYGALVASRVRATGLLTSGDRVRGVEVEDVETGRHSEIRAKVVLVATGVWGAGLLRSAPVSDRPLRAVGATAGVHLVVPRDRIRSSTGVISRSGSSVLLVVPWGRHWIIGRTQSRWDGAETAVVPSREDVDQLLADVNEVLGTPLSRADVQGSYAGLWPQLAPASTRLADRPAQPTGEYQVTAPTAGLVVVQGGTFSAYRQMAAAGVDAAARSIGGLLPESITDQVPLLGADGYPARWNQRHLLARRAGLHVARVEHLLNRYGALADQLLDLVATEPQLRAPLPGAEDYLAVEVVHAVTHEGATELSDLLARRTRISIETWDGGTQAAEPVARLMAPLLGWGDEQARRRVWDYRQASRAERAGQSPDRADG